MLFGISSGFPELSPTYGQVIHALLTRPPLTLCFRFRRFFHIRSVRLACVRHAASVRPEPGSNSPFNILFKLTLALLQNCFCCFLKLFLFVSCSCLIFNVRVAVFSNVLYVNKFVTLCQHIFFIFFLHFPEIGGKKDSLQLENLFPLAPRAGLEPATFRLTAECSTIELSRINMKEYRRRPTLPG